MRQDRSRRPVWPMIALAAALMAPGALPAADPPAADTPSPCPRGQFPDAKTGYCYACRPGFWRNPALSPGVRGACYSPAQREERPARRFDRVRGRACPAGQFESRGYCYRCDIGFDRNESYSPDRRGACYQEYPDREEPAIRHDRMREIPR